jgi:hypothetical protein
MIGVRMLGYAIKMVVAAMDGAFAQVALAAHGEAGNQLLGAIVFAAFGAAPVVRVLGRVGGGRDVFETVLAALAVEFE